MLEDFYSELFPSPLAGLPAPELRESCRPSPGSHQAAWGEQPVSEQEHRPGLGAEGPLLYPEPFVRVAFGPEDGEDPAAGGGLGGTALLNLSLGNGEQGAGCRHGECAAGKERRGPRKVPEPKSRTASPPEDPRRPSPDLLVPDYDYIEEAEESKSKWEQSRRSQPARGRGAIRGCSPVTSLRAQQADDANARLVPAAREAQILKEELLYALHTPRPLFSQENEMAVGNCGTSSVPHSVGVLQDQVVIDYWLPEE